MKTIVIVIALAATANAEPREQEVETEALAFVAKGMSVGYEHQVARAWSVEGFVGLRGAALADYTSTTWSAGVEARWWYRRAMAGPYIGLHASAGRTSLQMSTGEDLGNTWGLEQRVEFGWRFTIRDRIAIAPSLGIGEHEDLGGGLAAGQHPIGSFSLALGFLF